MLRTLILAFALGTSLFLFSQTETDSTAPKTEWGGYVKYLSSVSGSPGFDGLIIDNLIHHRLNFAWYPHKRWTVRVEARNRLLYGNQLLLVPNYGSLIDQYDAPLDLSLLWVDNQQFILHSVIDRLNVEYATEKLEIRVGRQRINWGINSVWNPNDLFNAFNYLDFDYEERPGTDAARLVWNSGALSSLEVAVSPARDLKRSIIGAKYGFNYKTYDLQVIGAYSRGDLVTGFGWSGYIADAGFKGEASLFVPTEASIDTATALVASVALDRQFGQYYISLGGLFNGGAAPGPVDLGALGGQSGLAAQGVSVRSLFPSRWATALIAQRQLSPLSSASVAIIYSPNSNLMIASPSITLSLAQNWDLDIIGQTFFADQNSWKHAGTTAFLRLKFSY
ncbi:MAG: hypothetical protein AB8F95_21140 [Bacteroidia bacterium]